jgi:histone deacetylase 6
MDPYLSTWYKSNSLIYVSPDHACWSDDDSARKVKKQRFGNVLMADIEVGRGPDNVGRMLKRFALLSPLLPSFLSSPPPFFLYPPK